MLRRLAAAAAAVLALAGCQVVEERGEARAAVPAVVISDGAIPAIPGPSAEWLARERPGESTVCRRFAREVAQAAVRNPDDHAAFLAALQHEFTAGASDPFALKEALEQGRWNPAYFYAGSGGFRPEVDDDRAAYRQGGNHQPGHFVSVLSIAAAYGPDQARLSLAWAGDYDPGEEDDLRLSTEAIRLGAGLASAAFAPADVARAVATLCRPLPARR